MEVRVENNRKKLPVKNRKKLHISSKVVFAGLMVCFLGAALAWGFSRKSTAVAAGTDYNMAKDKDGRSIFSIVEVVPDEMQGVLRLYTGGQTWGGQKVEELLTAAIQDGQVKWKEYDEIFYDDTAKAPSPGEAAKRQPFTVIPNGTGYKVVNNEIFKLCMLEIGNYDAQKTPYQNYLDNADALATFDKQYKISYVAVTPAELEKTDRSNINYLHIDAAPQLKNMMSLYWAIFPGKTKQWETDFSEGPEEDISFGTVLELYKQSVSATSRMAVAIESDALYPRTGTMNLRKFYQMLNYANDPAEFQNVFDEGTATNNNEKYIDWKTGEIHFAKGTTTDDWSDENLSSLMWNKITGGIAGKQSSWRGSDADNLPFNWLSGKNENILIYRQGKVYNDTPGYFGDVNNIGQIKTILDFTRGNLPPVADNPVKVLEIEPGTDFRFDESAGKERDTLAQWLDVTPESLDVTCVTPNELNGLTVDLASEYDMIYVGDKVGKMGEKTTYSIPSGWKTQPQPYQHIGASGDSVLTLPLINGLLKRDKTDAKEFASLAKRELKNPSTSQFLKNPGLALTLGEPIGNLGHARFSGNDITLYMKEQLNEFASSQQPIVVAASVCAQSYQLQRLKSEQDGSKIDSNLEIDSNMYSLFAERGLFMPDGEFRSEPVEDNIYNEERIGAANLPGGALRNKDKPKLTVTGSNDADGSPLILDKEKMDEDGWMLLNLAQSDSLTFSYKADLNNGAPYRMSVIIDLNGDGIFDAGMAGKDGKKSGPDVLQTMDITSANSEGEFTWQGTINAQKSICQFRVLLEEQGTKDGTIGLRAIWDGYMRPKLNSKDVKILQIMSDSEKQNTLSAQPAFQALIQSLTGEGTATVNDFDFTEKGFSAVTASQFNSEYTNVERLDDYDLIIVGFDYGTIGTDLSSESLNALNQYISVKKKPVIFTKDTVSYVNAENYSTPVMKEWRDMTMGDILQAGAYPSENDSHRKRKITEGEFFHYDTYNQQHQSDLANQIFTEKSAGNPPDYFCWEIKDPGYYIVPVAGTSAALYPDKADWGFNMTRTLRTPLGMDRFSVTTDLKPKKKRDPGTMRKTKDGGVLEEAIPEEIQGFTNGALLEFACTKDEYGNPILQSDWTLQHEPYAAGLALLGTAPRTDSIEVLNEGIIGNYPFKIGAADLKKIQISGGQHAPYYQLDLERTLKKNKSDDITVWYTLSGAGKNGETGENPSTYFDVTRRDAGNNYYLYSKENIYYTGYSLPDKSRQLADLSEAERTEMKLFINTIYAALSSSAAASEAAANEAVVRADGNVSCIGRSETAGASQGGNNQYACYYEIDDNALTFNFRIQSKTSGTVTKVTLGLKGKPGADGSLIIQPLAEGTYELLPDSPPALDAFPVAPAPVEPEGSDGGLTDDTGPWYQLRIPFSGEEAAAMREGLDGKTLVIAVGAVSADGAEGVGTEDVKPGTDAIHAEIRLVLRNLFDLD